MGFSSNASDFRPKTSAPAGNAPLISNKQSRQKQSNSTVVYVSNLSFTQNEQDLMDFFKQANFDPIRARLLYDNEGNSKGVGFVEMSSEGEATDAVSKLDSDFFQGRKLNISLAQSK